MKTLRLASVAAATLAVLAAIGNPAAAAPGPALPVIGSPSSISAGIFVPSDSNVRQAGGNTQLDVEFHYGLPVPNVLTATRTVISLGVQAGTHTGTHSTVIPLTISQLVSLNGGSPFASGAGYAGVGVGGWLENETGLSTATRFGGQAILGYNFTDAIFLEGKYQFVNHANGAVVTAGLRF